MDVNALHRGTWAELVGLHITQSSRDQVLGEVEVRPTHHQPQGIVHGGVYCSIIESMASIGAAIDANTHERNVVGLENHTSFIRATRAGKLFAKATPLTRGRRSQVWEVSLHNEEQRLVATGRVRLMVLEAEAAVAGGLLEGK